MNIRISNAKILSMNKDMEIIHGEVWISNDRILYVGSSKPADIHFDREIDACGNLVMPSFKNAHTHSAMTFLRSYADDLPLDRWLNDIIFPMEAKLKTEDIKDLCKLAFMEYLTSGITACMDMYFFAEETAKASVETGFRTMIVSPLNDFNESPETMERNYDRFNNYDSLISYGMGFHAEYTTSLDNMKKVAALSHKYETPIFTHAHETKKEVQECIRRFGKSPVGLFEEIELLDFGGAIYHGVWLDDNDIDILKRNGVGVVINSSSNLKLASGIAPTKELLDEGITLGIGTDGPASNNSLDMFKEMFLFTALAKVRENDASAVPAEAVLNAAVKGSAKIMGMEDCDCLAEGKKADLIMINLHSPNMQPENDIVKNIVYSGSKENVIMTMVNGIVLYENGAFTTVDEEAVYNSVSRVITKMKE